MTTTWTERYQHSMMNTFGPPKLTLVKGVMAQGVARQPPT